MNYRIYQNVNGWEYLLTTNDERLNSAIASINGSIYILVIKHYIEEDMDEPYYSGYASDYNVMKLTKKR